MSGKSVAPLPGARDDPALPKGTAVLRAMETKVKSRRKALTRLQRFAEGQTCTLRFPGCEHSGTVVLCHLPHPQHGTGIKGPDWHAVHGCRPCHDLLDGRDRCMTIDQRDVLRALAETQMRTVLAGIVQVDGYVPDPIDAARYLP